MAESAPNFCERCEKPAHLCVCRNIRPLPSVREILILQHPQEPDKLLGTARLASLRLERATLKIGLSWRNLKSALGREAVASRWVVLYLGSGIQGAAPTEKSPSSLILVDKKGVPLPESKKILRETEGVVVLDGTWSQAKALWWRNPWLLKLRRGILQTSHSSLYGKLRKEPRRECLSTTESVAYSLEALGESDAAVNALLEDFRNLLKAYSQGKIR